MAVTPPYTIAAAPTADEPEQITVVCACGWHVELVGPVPAHVLAGHVTDHHETSRSVHGAISHYRLTETGAVRLATVAQVAGMPWLDRERWIELSQEINPREEAISRVRRIEKPSHYRVNEDGSIDLGYDGVVDLGGGRTWRPFDGRHIVSQAERDEVVDGLIAELDAGPEVCDQCQGTGYLVDQTYGYAIVPAGYTPVQRCDQCSRFEGDEDATRAFAASFRQTRPVMWCPSSTGAQPGDWAVNTL